MNIQTNIKVRPRFIGYNNDIKQKFYYIWVYIKYWKSLYLIVSNRFANSGRYKGGDTYKTLKKMPSYRVPIEDEVFRSMKVDNFSKTPYSDATQVSGSFICHPHQNYLFYVRRYTFN